ncbi:MAG: YqiJ family protein [Abditibacteriales bacterium]|nr:YqiJ family protein [Abditibacteriales bacterium]MDW8364452.1 DUF1449 family protein [Abditibacteriales bacterium]
MGDWQRLFEWYNLIYTLPFGLAVFYLLVTTALGLIGGDSHDLGHDHDAHVDHDVDVEADHAVEVHAEHDVEAHAEHDVDHDAAHEAHGNHGHGFAHDALAFLGAGKVSFMLMVELFLLSWGVFGWIFNGLLQPILKRPEAFIVPSVGLTLLTSALFTRLTTGLVGKIIPKEESFALTRQQLVGLTGRTIFSVDHDSGAAHVRDQFGTLHQVACRTIGGGEIPRGREVLLVKYVAERDYYLVEQMPEDYVPRLNQTKTPAPPSRPPQSATETQPQRGEQRSAGG